MKRILFPVVLVSSLLHAAHGADYEADSQRRAKPFVDGMLNMMDRMGLIDLDDYPDRSGTDYDWDSPRSRRPFDGYPSSRFTPGINPPMAAPMVPYQSARPPSPLDGIWLGRSGELLVIRDGRFRIYQNRNRYRQGKLRIKGQSLFMHDPRTKATNKYEFATQKGRLVLRDADGQLLLYRRLRNR